MSHPHLTHQRRTARQFGGLKRTLRASLTRRVDRRVPIALIDRALAEAEELAASTGFPTLFFPVLAEEQVQRVSHFALEDSEPRPGGNLRSVAA